MKFNRRSARATGHTLRPCHAEPLESRALFTTGGYPLESTAPLVTANVPASAVAGYPVTLTFQAKPTSLSQPITGWSVDWGLGTPPENFPADAKTATHTFLTTGKTSIRIWARDSAGSIYQANNGVLDSGFAAQSIYPTTTQSTPGELVYSEGTYQDMVDMQVDPARHTTYLLKDRDYAVIRVLADGTLDPSWGTNGVASINMSSSGHTVSRMALLSDGGVLVAGGFAGDYWCVKYAATGQLDQTFGVGGIAKPVVTIYDTHADFVFPQSDGKILLLGQRGSSNFDYQELMVRLNANGTVDTSYGTNGLQLFDTGAANSLQSAVMQPDGKIVATLPQLGENTVSVVRLLPNGHFDPAFASNGIWSFQTPGQGTLPGLTLQPDGKILADGWFYGTGITSDSIVVRLTSTGALDSAFSGGVVYLPLSSGNDELRDIALTPDGGVVATGFARLATTDTDPHPHLAATVVKLDANGQFDATSANGGLQYFTSSQAEFGNFVRVLDGDWLIGGTKTPWVPPFDLTLRRLTAHTSFDLTIRPGPKAIIGSAGTSVGEGGSLKLTGIASVDPTGRTLAKYEWDLAYDGTNFTPDAVSAEATFDASQIDGPATRLVALRVTDRNGYSDLATLLVNIVNVAPAARLVGSSVTLGTASGVNFADVVDPGVEDTAAGLSYSFDFNNDGDFIDPGEVANSTASSASFTFAAAGSYLVRGRVTDNDGGYSDYTTTLVVKPNTPTDPASVSLEAETAMLSGGTVKSTQHLGYTGTGYADMGGTASAIKWTFARNGAGKVTLAVRYANGGNTNRPVNVLVNGVSIGTLVMAPTGGWSNWTNTTITATLTAGTNTVALVGNTSSNANVDSLTINTGSTPPPPPPLAGTISGFLFDDANKNGIYDTGDTQPVGRRVFLDANNNGLFDTGEISVLSATAGAFSFANLAAGSYRVREALPANTAYSTALADVTLAAGQVVSNLAIGTKATVVVPSSGTASISGSAFNDNNANGKFDTGDGYSKGIVVFLDANNNGKLDSNEVSTTTDNAGKYAFANLAAGTYRVRRTFPVAGYTYSTPILNPTLTAGQVRTDQSIGTKKV